ncbi:hypothetical protein GCM10017772_38400 [Promicromonospora soli]|uniref:Uncharacterized protein n=1 Tax=Promicromonospora soli TaxID=2035533 RepID=A0A919KZ53_9MICO|nr:hypothetical protein GCM10017772_38400 [Promicromonospora soli]
MLCESADSRIQVNKLGVNGSQLTPGLGATQPQMLQRLRRFPRATENPPWPQAEPLERELPRRETG